MGTSHKIINQIIQGWNLKVVIVSIAIITVVTICLFTSFKSFNCDYHEQFTSKSDVHNNSTLMDASDVSYISSKDGIKQWILKASYMCTDNKRGKAFICNPEIEFFLKSNEKFYLSANSGLINKLSNNITMFGDVYIHGWDVIVKTNHVEYDSNSLFLISQETTVFFGNDFSVNSDNLVINLRNELFQFKGNVKSKFTK